MTTLYSDCERIVRKAQLQSLEHRAGGEAGEGGTGSPDADLTGHQADVIEGEKTAPAFALRISSHHTPNFYVIR